MIEFFREDVLTIWVAGGWLMGPLFIIGMVIYYSVFQLFFQMRARPHLGVSPNIWAHWVDKPDESQGEIGRIIRYTQDDVLSTSDIRLRFSEVKKTLIDHVKRRLKFVNIIVGTAPLTGLLGTVSGMLTTFAGISSGAGGAQTIDTIAGGISEALITTEAGLVLAIPAYFALSRIRRMLDDLELFLTKLETTTLKRFLKLSAIKL